MDNKKLSECIHKLFDDREHKVDLGGEIDSYDEKVTHIDNCRSEFKLYESCTRPATPPSAVSTASRSF